MCFAREKRQFEMIMLAKDMWDGMEADIWECASQGRAPTGDYLLHWVQGAIWPDKISPTFPPDRWSQCWVFKITLLSDQLFDHKEVLRPPTARHETNLANDRLKHFSLYQNSIIATMLYTFITLRRLSMTTFHDSWPELGIEDGVYEWVDCGGDVAQPKCHFIHPWCFPGWGVE